MCLDQITDDTVLAKRIFESKSVSSLGKTSGNTVAAIVKRPVMKVLGDSVLTGAVFGSCLGPGVYEVRQSWLGDKDLPSQLVTNVTSLRLENWFTRCGSRNF